MRQEAPDPGVLYEIIRDVRYRPGWVFRLADIDRGQGCAGLTLDIVTSGFNSYHPEQGPNYSVHHYFPVPPAGYNYQSWCRWVFECLLLVERHEAMEFFVVDGRRPYAPHHGPGNDPYIVFEIGTDEEVRTSFRGAVKEPGA